MSTDIFATAGAGAISSTHPLDPISAEEYSAARAILDAAGKIGESTRFATVQLHEPHKDVVRAFRFGDRAERRLFAVLIDIATGAVHEAVVCVTTGTLESFVQVPTTNPPYGQPCMIMEEIERVEAIVKADRRWQEAIRNRGITNPGKCIILPLAAGQFGFENEVGRRVMRTFTLYRENQEDSPWASPIEGLMVLVDLIDQTVIQFNDYGSAPLPTEHGNYRSGDWGPDRTSLKPLEIVQPAGPSYTVEGRRVTWENWSFLVGFNAREGLVLHDLSYQDGGRHRPVLYRASISEMVVPYGDPHRMRFWISYFDIGEYGLGKLATSLALGCHCLGEVHYFDVTLPDDHGNPYIAKNVICLHEEDYGVLWKHAEIFNNMADETRRSRRLVISFWTAIGNYDYGFFWYLYLDGTIEFEVKLTGIMLVNGQNEGIENPHATPVAPGLVAPYHQHLFNVRLDMTVDGVANSVEEVDVVGVATGPGNKYGTAFTARTTVLRTESEAGRFADSSASRVWQVVNRDSTNRMGLPVGYKLMPQGSPVLLAQPDSVLAKRAAFATRHLWVTQYDPCERYAAGDYPNQHAGGAGIPAYQAADRPLDGEDIVLWHTFGTTHLPRAEDWPVMPVEYAGFMLKPANFFDRNPALDVPPPSSVNGHHSGKAPSG